MMIINKVIPYTCQFSVINVTMFSYFNSSLCCLINKTKDKLLYSPKKKTMITSRHCKNTVFVIQNTI